MDKDELLFQMYKNEIVDRSKLNKLAENPRDLYARIVNYQIIMFGEQLSKDYTSETAFNLKIINARHRSSAKKAYYRNRRTKV